MYTSVHYSMVKIPFSWYVMGRTTNGIEKSVKQVSSVCNRRENVHNIYSCMMGWTTATLTIHSITNSYIVPLCNFLSFFSFLCFYIFLSSLSVHRSIDFFFSLFPCFPYFLPITNFILFYFFSGQNHTR